MEQVVCERAADLVTDFTIRTFADPVVDAPLQPLLLAKVNF